MKPTPESKKSPWASRKLWLTIGFVVVATWLALKLEGTSLTEWGAVVAPVLAAYFAGNVGEHWTKKQK